jgi:predicted RNA-binding protein YlqC (UPF0109 family)
MKNLLEFILNHLVDHPEDVKVEESEGDRGYTYTLFVHPEDMGKVIGKNGRIIQAIRNIAKVRAVKENIRAQVVLADEDEPATASSAPEAAEASAA